MARPHTAVGLGLALLALAACAPPQNGRGDPLQALNPFCRYDQPYRLDAVIEVSSERLSSHVVRQRARSREWIQVMNSSGCDEYFGTAVGYRTKGDVLVLLNSSICTLATERLKAGGEVDVLATCAAAPLWHHRHPQGYLVDSAVRPTTWMAFSLRDPGVPVRVISLTARATKSAPSDDLDTVSPAILRTGFDEQGADSPDTVLEFKRRYSDGFAHQAAKGQVQVR